MRSPARSCSLFLLAVAALAAACQRSGPAAGSGAAGPRVALVLKTLNSPFFIEMQRGAQEAARAKKVDLVVQAAEREVDVEKQMQIIENLIETKVAALLVTPSGSKEVVPALLKANAAKIPVVILDTQVDPGAAKEANVSLASFVGSDNYEGGKLAGQQLVAVTGGKATVAILEGIPGHETGDSRLRGFKEAVSGSPGIKVVASQPANWERDLGFTVFQNMMQAHPDLDAVFACNDMMALGAVEAIAAAGKTGKIRVIGFDAVDDAKQAINAGSMVASVAQQPAEMGRLGVETVVKILAGESVPAEQRVSIGLVTAETLKAEAGKGKR
jgi:ribose transport system substrate-binding protein